MSDPTRTPWPTTSSADADDVYTGSDDAVPSIWEYGRHGFALPLWTLAIIAAGGVPLLVCVIGLLLHVVNRFKQADHEKRKRAIIEEKRDKAERGRTDMLERSYAHWSQYEAEGHVPSVYTLDGGLDCTFYDGEVSQAEDGACVYYNGAYSWDERQSLWGEGQYGWDEGHSGWDEEGRWHQECGSLEGYFVDGFGFHWGYDLEDYGNAGHVVIEELTEAEGGETLKVGADVENTHPAQQDADTLIFPADNSDGEPLALASPDSPPSDALPASQPPAAVANGHQSQQQTGGPATPGTYMNVSELASCGLPVPVLPHPGVHPAGAPHSHPLPVTLTPSAGAQHTAQPRPPDGESGPPPTQLSATAANSHYSVQQKRLSFTSDDLDHGSYPDGFPGFRNIPGGSRVGTMPRARASMTRCVTFKDDPDLERGHSFVDLYTTTRGRRFVPTRPAPPPPSLEPTYSRTIPRLGPRSRPALDLTPRHSYLSVVPDPEDAEDGSRSSSLGGGSGYEVPLPSEPTSPATDPAGIGINPGSSTLLVHRGSTLAARIYAPHNAPAGALVAEVAETSSPPDEAALTSEVNVYDDIPDRALDPRLDQQFPVYENYHFVTTLNLSDEGYSSDKPPELTLDPSVLDRGTLDPSHREQVSPAVDKVKNGDAGQAM